MGGYGSGRYGGRPTADMALRIDLAWMLRTGKAREGAIASGSLHWSRGRQPVGWIGYRAVMDEAGSERLELSYSRGPDNARESVKQTVRLVYTVPNYGGKRWWMICPYRGCRAGKLYLPNGGDRFASRMAWRLGYQSQRECQRDRRFSKLNALQRKLGCQEGYEAPLRRPKGMWHRTFERHQERYWQLEYECDLEMVAMVQRLKALLGLEL